MNVADRVGGKEGGSINSGQMQKEDDVSSKWDTFKKSQGRSKKNFGERVRTFHPYKGLIRR